jgi:hypothetical protein
MEMDQTVKNVISICNAGKREHGEMHWYWAVWINVDDHTQWAGQQPDASGLSETKAKARQAAWKALKSATAHHRAYFTGWAIRFLWSENEKDTRPCFSRHNIGKNRWYWVVGRFMEEPDSVGIAECPEVALEQAERKVGPVRHVGNWMARSQWAKQRAIQRSQQKPSGSATARLEFVYECHRSYSDYDGSGSDSIKPHRIVKRTNKRLYVDAEPYREHAEPTGDWWDWVESTFVLDRHEFETTGKAARSSRHWWSRTYYASPEVYFAERRRDSRPECFVALGVDCDATEKQIKSAYRRLAKTHHPDMGGDPEEFKQVRLAYEKAMTIVGKSIG